MEAEMSLLHEPLHEYTFKLPGPPPVLVPAITWCTQVDRELRLRDRPTDATANDPDLGFLKPVGLGSISDNGEYKEWEYQQRWEAQKILPWLSVGPVPAARDKKYLEREGITMMMAIRARPTPLQGVLRVGEELGIRMEAIDTPDHGSLIKAFPHTTQIINRHLADVWQSQAATPSPRLGHVLVFCDGGNDVSPAVVAAYLMEMLDGFDHIAAMQVCQSRRFCINFDETTKNTLRAHWDILQAKRAILGVQSDAGTAASHHGHQTVLPLREGTARHKRHIEEAAQDEDMDMDSGVDADDALRFLGRSNLPFAAT
ncbi:hypothetical protein M011DRAFT_467397 [Sporormia fimetaria CBS 119925]|uniref:Uncharacterized protein n=1 Tax=Sporormia fimetaria CBS 119925 TaxID=1340428 RepID=A0A6A6VDJ1_9PLEO|nr:hypothetical protein M011DRAFT_467397 [Sporormia fimetaria CBS 119925]